MKKAFLVTTMVVIVLFAGATFANFEDIQAIGEPLLFQKEESLLLSEEIEIEEKLEIFEFFINNKIDSFQVMISYKDFKEFMKTLITTSEDYFIEFKILKKGYLISFKIFE